MSPKQGILLGLTAGLVLGLGLTLGVLIWASARMEEREQAEYRRGLSEGVDALRRDSGGIGASLNEMVIEANRALHDRMEAAAKKLTEIDADDLPEAAKRAVESALEHLGPREAVTLDD
jgi:hypothetical protein